MARKSAKALNEIGRELHDASLASEQLCHGLAVHAADRIRFHKDVIEGLQRDGRANGGRKVSLTKVSDTGDRLREEIRKEEKESREWCKLLLSSLERADKYQARAVEERVKRVETEEELDPMTQRIMEQEASEAAARAEERRAAGAVFGGQ